MYDIPARLSICGLWELYGMTQVASGTNLFILEHYSPAQLEHLRGVQWDTSSGCRDKRLTAPDVDLQLNYSIFEVLSGITQAV